MKGGWRSEVEIEGKELLCRLRNIMKKNTTQYNVSVNMSGLYSRQNKDEECCY